MSIMSAKDIAATRAAIAGTWGSSGVVMTYNGTVGSAGAPKETYTTGASFSCAIAPFSGNTALIPDALRDKTLFYASVPVGLACTPKDQLVIDGVTYNILDDPGAPAPDALGRRLMLERLQ